VTDIITVDKTDGVLLYLKSWDETRKCGLK